MTSRISDKLLDEWGKHLDVRDGFMLTWYDHLVAERAEVKRLEQIIQDLRPGPITRKVKVWDWCYTCEGHIGIVKARTYEALQDRLNLHFQHSSAPWRAWKLEGTEKEIEQ